MRSSCFALLFVVGLLCALVSCEDTEAAAQSATPSTEQTQGEQATANENAAADAAAATTSTTSTQQQESADVNSAAQDVAGGAGAVAGEVNAQTEQQQAGSDVAMDDPTTTTLRPPSQDNEPGEDLSYLEFVGFSKHPKADECENWHHEMDALKAELETPEMKALNEHLVEKHFLESQMAYINKQIDRQRQECAQLNDVGDERARCNEFVQVRIAHSVEQSRAIQSKLSQLVEKLQGENAFRKQQLQAQVDNLRRQIARCPHEVNTSIKEKLDKKKAEESGVLPTYDENGRVKIPTTFASYEDMQKWLAEHDPESPAQLAKARAAEEERIVRERAEQSRLTMEALAAQAAKVKMPSPEEMQKRDLRRQRGEL